MAGGEFEVRDGRGEVLDIRAAIAVQPMNLALRETDHVSFRKAG